MKIGNINTEKRILFTSYILIFVSFIFQDALYSPDTWSYINAEIYRSPGYPIFSKLFAFVFGKYFDLTLVTFQLLFTFFSIQIFFNTASKIIKLNWYEKILLFLILIFPIFNPLLVANNICSEGLSYPFYLLLISYTLQYFFQNKSEAFFKVAIVYILLTLTRSQFFIFPIIFALLYILKFKKSIFQKQFLKKFLIILSLPIICIILDKSYHKLKDGVFVSTPFSFINATASALYVSEKNDQVLFEDDNQQEIFVDCYGFLSEHDWLISEKKNQSYMAKYKHFHNNMGNICNYTLHDIGREYYLSKNYSIVEASIEIEKTAKSIFLILVKSNFKKWVTLYFNNVLHGFKSIFIFIFIVAMCLFTFIKLLKNYTETYALLFMFSMLILSNALIVAFASHSIMRYLFYNYSLFFLIVLILIKTLRHEKKS